MSKNTDTDLAEQNAERIAELAAALERLTDAVIDDESKAADKGDGFTLTPRESRHRGNQIKENRRQTRKWGDDTDKSESPSTFTLDPRKTAAKADADESEDESEEEKTSSFTLDPRKAGGD